METNILSPKARRQRKALLVLPLVAAGFTTLLFRALGGGGAAATAAAPAQGLNTRLPEARPKDDPGLNKMSYYDKAASDSLRLKEQMRTDPYYRPGNDTGGLQFPAYLRPADRVEQTAARRWAPDAGNRGSTDQVYRRLAQLQAAVNRPEPPARVQAWPEAAPVRSQQAGPQNEQDPELDQMNGLLEKILDIQHPDRVKERTSPPDKETGDRRFLAIPAVIDGKQKITQGTVVRLRLTDTATISGQLIPKGQLIYGSGELYNQRLTMTIRIIRMNNVILPVDLTVFDKTDGLEGICVPEAVTGDAAREGAASGVQGLELMSLDPSVGTQLAGAGVNAAKGLFSKKIRRIKAKLKDGHPLLLRDNKKLKAQKINL